MGGKHTVECRIVAGDQMTVQIRDDCRSFDPKKRLEQFDTDNPFRNLGIKLVANESETMIYQNIAGLNVLIIKC